MTVRRFVLLAVIGVVAGAVAWLPGWLGGRSESDGAAPPLRTASASSTETAAVPPTAPSDSPLASGRPAGQAGGTVHGGTGVLPRPSSAATWRSRLPLPPRGPLVSMPLPSTAYGKGTMVAGYPTALRPLRGSTIETSSVSPADDILQVALTAHCTRPCDVLRHYRVLLGRHGFRQIDAVSVANTPATALQRGKDTVNVTVVAAQGATVEYAVLAILHAGA